MNAAGLQAVKEVNPISNFFKVFLLNDHRRLLQEGDAASSFGAAIDELIRHQPELKELIACEISGVLDWLVSPESIGESHYFQPTSTNKLYERIEVVAKFLEGIQNPTHSSDFLAKGGLEKLYAIYTLDDLPYDFIASTAAASLISLFRALAETESEKVLSFLLERLAADLHCGNILKQKEEPEKEFLGSQNTTEVISTLKTMITVNCLTKVIIETSSPIFQENGSELWIRKFASFEEKLLPALVEYCVFCVRNLVVVKDDPEFVVHSVFQHTSEDAKAVAKATEYLLDQSAQATCTFFERHCKNATVKKTFGRKHKKRYDLCCKRNWFFGISHLLPDHRNFS